MHISLYSCHACWLIAPADVEPIAAKKAWGFLRFEGTVPPELIPEGMRAQLLSQCEAAGFAEVSEDLALALLDQTLSLYGTLTVQPISAN